MRTKQDIKTASAPETRTLPAAENTKAWHNVPVSQRRYLIEQERTIPAEKPTAIMTEDDCKRSHYYVQWLASKAHAAQLAEALKDVLPYAEGYKSSAGAIERANEALAAYEEGK